MQTVNKQQGMSAIGAALLLVLIGFLTLLVLKIAPIYIEGFKVESSLESLKNQPEVAAKTGPEIEQLLLNRLDINDVDSVGPQHIEIKRLDRGVTVSVKYEVRREMFGNVDVVVKFDRSVTVLAR
ncbi:MAG: DUF4845 domain-containing protein [Pseudomonadota bacterium]